MPRAALEQMAPEGLDILHQRLALVGVVLAQIALLEVVADKGASDNAKIQAAKVLTSTWDDTTTLAQQLRASPLAHKTPEELRNLVTKLRDIEALEKLAGEDETG